MFLQSIRSRVCNVIKTKLFQGCFPEHFSKVFWLEVVARRYSLKEVFSPNSLQLYWKKTLTQVLSCEFCKIFLNNISHNTSGWLLLTCNFHGSICQSNCDNSTNDKLLANFWTTWKFFDKDFQHWVPFNLLVPGVY